jgi:hypothetical protein
MQYILKKFQFAPSMESLPDWYEGIVEIWRRPKVQILSGLSGDTLDPETERFPGDGCEGQETYSLTAGNFSTPDSLPRISIP